MDELLGEFLTETNESLEVIDLEMVTLEKNPDSPEILSNIFRLVHTIKGTCGFLGLPRLEKVAHSGENILGKIRDGELSVSSDIVSLVLEALDRIREIMADLEATETEPVGDDIEIIKRLDAAALGETPVLAAAAGGGPALEIVSDSGAAVAEEETAGEPASEPESTDDDVENHDRDLKPGEVPLDQLERIFQETEGPLNAGPAEADLVDEDIGRDLKPGEVPLDELERIFQETEGPVKQAGAASDEASVPTDSSAEEGPADEPPADQPVAAAPVAAPPPAAEAENERKPAESSAATQSIRVSVDLLENLMNMVSELVLSRNQLLQLVRNDSDSDFAVPLQALSHVTTELQESAMQTRMQPIGSAWNKLPRIIRDLSNELGKKIDLDMRGADTELDRQVLELIRDPLTHMVRNSADHGLEVPDVRVAAGKSEIGKVVLNAFHEGGHIIIEIKDDGAGINVDRVKDKALASGLATAEELETMPEQKALRFIFAPGFSTAAQVTSVSGRGVGMDVVRTNIEKIGGTVDLKSVAGKGSTFTIKIPLTLAIVSALVIECSKERFAIPQIAVLELVRASDNSEHRIETINETPVLRLRERLLPLVYLRNILKLNDDVSAATEQVATLGETVETGDANAEAVVESEAPAQSSPAATVPAKQRSGHEAVIIVTQVGNYRFGIVVDSVYDSEEIVVKPVAPILSHINEFSGNTILGDGSVIMILDPNGIAEASGELSVPPAEEAGDEVATTRRPSEGLETLLVFHAGDAEPKAVPLSLVARLEEVSVADIETSNGKMVVQYRGHLMPLVEFDSSFQMRTEGAQPVIVFTEDEHSMGLLVDRIVDIIEEKLDIELSSSKPGLVGSAVIDGKATGIMDTAYHLTRAFDDWFKSKSDRPFGEEAHLTRILLVDDSKFFRDILTPVLSTAGYNVTTAVDATEALELRDAGEKFELIISDIEMPGMDGFEFATEVRQSSAWKTIPLVALSSHATQQDRQRGEAAGFDDYVAKHDRDALLQILTRTLTEHGVAA